MQQHNENKHRQENSELFDALYLTIQEEENKVFNK